MTRRLLAVTIGLAATVSFLVGLIVAGTMTPSPAASAPEPRLSRARIASSTAPVAAVASFADIAERLNPAVVNIDATMRAGSSTSRRFGPSRAQQAGRGARDAGQQGQKDQRRCDHTDTVPARELAQAVAGAGRSGAHRLVAQVAADVLP